MAQFHAVTLLIEDFTQENYNHEAMRTLAQDVANYATQRAQELNLDSGRALASIYRDGDEKSDYKYLESFDGVKK